MINFLILECSGDNSAARINQTTLDELVGLEVAVLNTAVGKGLNTLTFSRIRVTFENIACVSNQISCLNALVTAALETGRDVFGCGVVLVVSSGCHLILSVSSDVACSWVPNWHNVALE